MTSTIVPGAVIAAVDGSVHARRAVRWAAEQAHLEGRPLMVVHATGEEDIWAGPWGPLDDIVPVSQVVLEEAVALAEEAFPDLTVEGVAISGQPRKELVRVSTTARLLVLGSRGRGVVRSKLLGSVSAHVAKHAACPVVVTRPTPQGAVKDGVVVGADGTAESLAVVDFAFRQASLHGLPLTVMHCVYDAVAAVVGARGPAYDLADADELRLLLAETVVGFAEKYPDVRVQTRLDRGLVEECLTTGPRPWDLIVVGRHPGSQFQSTATAVLERSHSVVAVVPESAPSQR